MMNDPSNSNKQEGANENKENGWVEEIKKELPEIFSVN